MMVHVNCPNHFDCSAVLKTSRRMVAVWAVFLLCTLRHRRLRGVFWGGRQYEYRRGQIPNNLWFSRRRVVCTVPWTEEETRCRRGFALGTVPESRLSDCSSVLHASIRLGPFRRVCRAKDRSILAAAWPPPKDVLTVETEQCRPRRIPCVWRTFFHQAECVLNKR